MRGIIEFQNNLYRTAALLLKNDDRITRLSDAEKEAFELVFKVRKGSSDLEASARDQANALGTKLIEKMSQRQVFIAVLLAIVLYFGSGLVTHYLDNQLETRRIESSEKAQGLDAAEKSRLTDIIEALVKENKEHADIVKRAIKASRIAGLCAEETQD